MNKLIIIIIATLACLFVFLTQKYERPLSPAEYKLNEIRTALIDNEIILCQRNPNTLCINERNDRVNIFSNNPKDWPKNKSQKNTCLAVFLNCREDKLRSISTKELLTVYDPDQTALYLAQRNSWLRFLQTQNERDLEPSDELYFSKIKEVMDLEKSLKIQ